MSGPVNKEEWQQQDDEGDSNNVACSISQSGPPVSLLTCPSHMDIIEIGVTGHYIQYIVDSVDNAWYSPCPRRSVSNHEGNKMALMQIVICVDAFK